MQTDKIYLAFYLGLPRENPKTTAIDVLTCLFTESRFSHVELVVDLEDRTGLCLTASRRDGGVRAKTIHLEENWEIYQIDTHLSSAEIKSWFEPHYGKKYDHFGALGVTFPFFKNDTKRWFCSEIIAACLGLDNYHKYSPQDLFNSLVDTSQNS